MPRYVRHELDGPIRIDPQDKPVFICGCGLTRSFPFCDGAHKTCRTTEEPGRLYVYDRKGQIVEVRDDDAPSDAPGNPPGDASR